MDLGIIWFYLFKPTMIWKVNLILKRQCFTNVFDNPWVINTNWFMIYPLKIQNISLSLKNTGLCNQCLIKYKNVLNLMIFPSSVYSCVWRVHMRLNVTFKQKHIFHYKFSKNKNKIKSLFLFVFVWRIRWRWQTHPKWQKKII